MKPHVLLLCHRIPYPPNKGDKVRSFHLLKHLLERYQVHLAAFIDDPDDWQHVSTLKAMCASTHFVGRNSLDRLLSARALLRGEALTVAYYRDRGIQQYVDGLLDAQPIEQCVVFSGPMAQYVDVGHVRTVVDFCDVDSAKWTQYAAAKTGLMRWVYAREGRTLLAFEDEVARQCERSVFVTEPEAALFRSLGAHPKLMTVVENGVDHRFFSPEAPGESPYPTGGPVIVFTGAMDYFPNEDAVAWFSQAMLPALQARHSGLRLAIVGAKPSQAVQKLAERPGVIVTGRVPDIRPYLAHASCAVVPLRIARGIQNKALEAMSMACPSVISEASAGVLKGVRGRDYLVAQSADEYVDSISQLLNDPASARAMGLQARQVVLEHYDWTTNLNLLFDESVPRSHTAGSMAPTPRVIGSGPSLAKGLAFTSIDHAR